MRTWASVNSSQMGAQRARPIKVRRANWISSTLKTLLCQHPANRLNRQATDGEQAPATHRSDKGIIPNDQDLAKFNSEKTNNTTRKEAKGMTRHFTKKDIAMAAGDANENPGETA